MLSHEQLFFLLPLFTCLCYIHLCSITAQRQFDHLSNSWGIFPNFCFDKVGFWTSSNIFLFHSCISHFLLTLNYLSPFLGSQNSFTYAALGSKVNNKYCVQLIVSAGQSWSQLKYSNLWVVFHSSAQAWWSSIFQNWLELPTFAGSLFHRKPASVTKPLQQTQQEAPGAYVAPIEIFPIIQLFSPHIIEFDLPEQII